MVNKQKRKGTAFENQAVKLLNDLIVGAEFKRVPGSGAIGTIVNEPMLTGDIKGKIEHFPQPLKGECKSGYSNKSGGEAKSFSLKKEWLDKIKMEAANMYAFPIFLGHFDNARSGVKTFVCLDIEDFAMLINSYTDLQRDMIEMEERGNQ